VKVRSPPAVALPASLIKPRPLVALGSPNSRDRWSRDVDCATTGRGFLGRARPLLEKPVRSGAHAAAFVMTFDVALGVVPCALVEDERQPFAFTPHGTGVGRFAVNHFGELILEPRHNGVDVTFRVRHQEMHMGRLDRGGGEAPVGVARAAIERVDNNLLHIRHKATTGCF